MMYAVHKRLNDPQSIYLDDLKLLQGGWPLPLAPPRGRRTKVAVSRIMIAAATEVCNANSEWLTNVAAGDDNNGCYHGGLQLQRTTAMVTAEACDGCFVLRTIPTRA